MKAGLQISSFTWPGGPTEIGPTLGRAVRTADDVGFDSIWVMDHFFQIRSIGRPEEPMLEGFTTLGHLAALDTHLRPVEVGASDQFVEQHRVAAVDRAEQAIAFDQVDVIVGLHTSAEEHAGAPDPDFDVISEFVFADREAYEAMIATHARPEVAAAIGVSRATAYRQWTYARSWLRCARAPGRPRQSAAPCRRCRSTCPPSESRCRAWAAPRPASADCGSGQPPCRLASSRPCRPRS